MAKNKMMIYGCGGAGTNLAQQYLLKKELIHQSHAQIQACLIDTSNSSLHPEVPKEHFMLIGTRDGSGGVRGENFRAAEKSVRDIMTKFPPADINIIVASASGGSGNTIAAYLHREIALADKPVISFLIADTQSSIAIRNSGNTMVTYNNFAQKLNKPFITNVFINTDRLKVDNEIHRDIKQIALLFSNEHRELDNTDLRNFLDYTRVTKYPARLASLTWQYFNQDNLAKLEECNLSPVTVAMLHSSAEIRHLTTGKYNTEYLTEGYLNTETDEEGTVVYTIDFEYIVKLNQTLKTSIELNNKTVEENRKQCDFELGFGDKEDLETDDGLVL